MPRKHSLRRAEALSRQALDRTEATAVSDAVGSDNMKPEVYVAGRRKRGSANYPMDGQVPGEANPDAMRRTPERDEYSFQAIRLLKARLAAGFKSGKAASEAHGWSVGTYVGHENGRRKLLPHTAVRYAEAFGVPATWLTAKEGWVGEPQAVERAKRLDGLEIDQVPHAFASPDVEPKAILRAHQRLIKARLDGGFASVKAAARFLGLPATTCYAHESGQNNIGARAARLYGRAYGADETWLLKGSFEPTPDRPRPTGGPRAQPDEVSRLAAALRDGGDPRTGGFPRLPDESARLLLEDAGSGPFVVARVGAAAADDAKPGDKVVIALDAVGGAGLYAWTTSDGSVRLDRLRDEARPDDGVVGRVLLVITPR